MRHEVYREYSRKYDILKNLEKILNMYKVEGKKVMKQHVPVTQLQKLTNGQSYY